MRHSARWLALVLVLACRESRSGVPETGPPDVATRTGSPELEDSGAAVEYEAPRSIPGVRAQIALLQEPSGATPENVTAFRSGVGHLIDAMRADLVRFGVTDTGAFRALSDSLMREFGGGPGTLAQLEPEKVRPAIAQVERLIAMYEERMRAAAR
jgi:hypothetical protein